VYARYAALSEANLMDARRFHYELELKALEAAAVSDGYRQPTCSDLDLLAELMLDAYTGTIDYDGETVADAQREIEDYFARHPLLHHSLVYAEHEAIRCACLVSYVEDRGTPLVAYVMTAQHWKRQGLARRALSGTLCSLSNARYDRVLATITEGNTASERLFAGMGFRRLMASRH
jgi:RimJ/RimL family protein N-acetyltransferase